MSERRNMPGASGAPSASRLLLAVVSWLVLLLAACAGGPSSTPEQVQPPGPVATPMVLGVTIEAPLDSSAEPTPETLPQAIDTTLPAWTLLYYASADNDAAPYVWDAINQMEMVADSSEVRVVADVDWAQGDDRTGSEPVRYVISADTDPDLILSEGAAMLEEANFGDPATLADFLTWGIQAYPAQRYALILGGHGGGWRGCCLDSDTGGQAAADSLSLAEIQTA